MPTFEAASCQAEIGAQLPFKPGQEVGCTHIWEEAYPTFWHGKKCPAHGAAQYQYKACNGVSENLSKYYPSTHVSVLECNSKPWCSWPSGHVLPRHPHAHSPLCRYPEPTMYRHACPSAHDNAVHKGDVRHVHGSQPVIQAVLRSEEAAEHHTLASYPF